MKKQLLLLLSGFWVILVYGQTELAFQAACQNANYPVPPADSCQLAPPFCASFLNGFCSGNAGFVADAPGNLVQVFDCSIENNQWLTFVPCDDTVQFVFSVSDCSNALGLEFSVLQTVDCQNFTAISGCLSIDEGLIDTLLAVGLTPGETYHLMVDGIGGDVCQWEIHTVAGASDGKTLQEENTPGFIQGEDKICLLSPATPSMPFTYSATGPVCELVPSDSLNSCTPGTEWDCPPAPQKISEPFPDTLIVPTAFDTIWHILPPSAGFFVNGDSIGSSVEIVWDSVGIFYVDADIVGIAFDTIPYINDGIIMCGTICPDDQPCDIEPKKIFVDAPDNRFETYVICQGDCITPYSQTYCSAGIFQELVTDSATCVDTVLIEVEVFPVTNTTLQFNVCPGECAFYENGVYCPGQHQIVLTGWQGCDSIVNLLVDVIPIQASISGNSVLTCANPSVNLTVATTPVSPLLNIQWTGPGVNGQVTTTVTASNPGTYQAQVFTPFCTLPLTASQTVVAGFLYPDLNVSGGPFSILLGETFDLASLAIVDANGTNPVISFHSATPPSPSNQLPGTLVTPTATTTYFIQASNDICTDVESMTLVVANPGAVPGDSCQFAPLFCGEFLNGFQSSNLGATPVAPGDFQQAFGCQIENNQFLRFIPCEAEVEMTITLSNCTNDVGLEAGIFSTNDCENFTSLHSCVTLNSGIANTLTVNGLTPGEIYYLVLDGIGGDACDYQIEVVSGISLDPPQWVTVSEGYVTGPASVCMGDLATYTIVPPDCQLWSGGLGGCLLPPEACSSPNDSTALVWHIPTVASFISDSVNVTTIQVIWNGLPTPGNDSIWVEYLFFPDTTGADSLVFCDSPGNASAPPINGMTVQGLFFTEILTAHLTCANPTVDFCGQTIGSAGIYVCPVFCGEQILTVTADFTGQFFDLGLIGLCPGECFELLGIQYCNPGTYTETFINPANGCEDVYVFTIQINSPLPLLTGPVFQECDATNQFFTISFQIQGGTPPYLVNGNTPTGNFFQSQPIPSGSGYTFVLTDADTCAPQQIIITGTFDCPCVTFAGTVSQVPQVLCESETANVTFNNDAQLDPNDILVFALHTNGGNTLGNILEINATGNFGFVPGTMAFGQTYYISPVAGNGTGTTIDLNDVCLSVGTGQPVIFYAIPVLEILPHDSLNCLVDSLTISTLASGGSGNFSFSWSGPGSFFSNEANPVVSLPGEYICLLTDNLAGCENSASTTLISDTEPPAFTVNNGELSCSEPEAMLEAIAQTSGITFSWNLPTGETVNGATLLTGISGTYTVVATGQNGCTSIATPQVSGSPNAELRAELEVNLPTCFGDENGRISVLNVTGGTAPYLLELNGETSPSQTWENLPAGGYLLTMEDAAGCPGDSLISLPEPPEVLVDLGPDQTITLGETITLEIQASITPDSIIWTGPNGLVWEDVIFLQIQPTESGQYTVEIFDENNCGAADDVYVTVEALERVYIPNVFSPNGDGQNDVLTVFGGKELKLVRSLRIFDRWGELVFENKNFPPNDPTHGWDGNFNGKRLKSAVFVYLAKVEFANGETKLLAGDVALIR